MSGKISGKIAYDLQTLRGRFTDDSRTLLADALQTLLADALLTLCIRDTCN